MRRLRMWALTWGCLTAAGSRQSPYHNDINVVKRLGRLRDQAFHSKFPGMIGLSSKSKHHLLLKKLSATCKLLVLKITMIFII